MADYYSLIILRSTITTSIDDEQPTSQTVPNQYILAQNYPNPFNPETTIRFSIPVSSEVIIKIYNLLGNEIKSLVFDYLPAGEHSAHWNGTDNSGQKVSSGLYIYRMKAGKYSDVKKMMFIK